MSKTPEYQFGSTSASAQELSSLKDRIDCLLQRTSKVHESTVQSEQIVSSGGDISTPESLRELPLLDGSLKLMQPDANVEFVVGHGSGRGSTLHKEKSELATRQSLNGAAYFTHFHSDQEADTLMLVSVKVTGVHLAIGVALVLVLLMAFWMMSQYGWFSWTSPRITLAFPAPRPTLPPPPSAHQKDPGVQTPHAARGVDNLKSQEPVLKGVLDVVTHHSLSVHAPGFSRHCINIANQGSIDEFYDMSGRELGRGSFGSVQEVIHKASGNVRAVKNIPKSSLTATEALAQEIEITRVLDHPNIVRLYEVFEDARCIYLVMEVCTGGELFDAILNADSGFSERSAARLMKQVVGAVFYMHSLGIVHRDLKPENFLLAEDVSIDDSALKLVDFGTARRTKPGTPMTTLTFTPYYVAPEVMKGSYNLNCDIWSLGVLLYVLLCGRPPFNGDSEEEILRSVRKGTFSFNKPAWQVVSDDAKDLIEKMLVIDAEKRHTAEQVLHHPWVDKLAPKASNAALSQALFKNLRGFQAQSKFKKAALTAMAKHLGDSKIQDLREMFYALDADGNGRITLEELSDGIKKMGMDVPEDLKRIMCEVDSDGSGEIDYTEFLAATLDRRHFMCEDLCWAAFRTFDLDGNGRITKEELLEVFTRGEDQVENLEEMLGMHREEIEQIVQDADVDGDGEIDFEEFVLMLSGGKTSPTSSQSPQLRSVKAVSSSTQSDDDTPGEGSTRTSGRVRFSDPEVHMFGNSQDSLSGEA